MLPNLASFRFPGRKYSLVAISVLLSTLAITAAASIIPVNTLPITIGADNLGGSRFTGEIAAVRIYSRSLNASEISKIASGTPDGPVKLPGLQAEWLCGLLSNQVCGNTAADGLGMHAEGLLASISIDGIRAANFGEGFLRSPNDPRLNPRRQMTIEAWIRPDLSKGAQGGRIVDKITTGGTDGWLLDTWPADTLRLIVGSKTVTTGFKLTNGKWTHVAAVVDADGEAHIYVDAKRIVGSVDGEDVSFSGSTKRPADITTLWYRRPAVRWTQALPFGSGRLGGMIYGGIQTERIELNEDTLWSGEPRDTMPPEAAKYVPEVKSLLLQGRNREAHDLTARKLLGPFFQCYLPMGSLSLAFHKVSAVKNYRRTLSLRTGIAGVEYKSGDAVYTREAFASHPGNAIVVHLMCNKPGRISFLASLSSLLHYKTAASGNTIVLTGRCPKFADAYTGKPIEYDDRKNGEGIRFEARLVVMNEGGRVTVDHGSLRVKNANSVMLLLVARTSYNGFNNSPGREGRNQTKLTLADMVALKGRTYRSIKSEHVADFSRLFDRVDLRLAGDATIRPGEPDNSALPTDERVASYEPGSDPGLAALYYQFGRYLLISGSRPGCQPLNLQGIWTHQLYSPWAANWTLNCNAEINYWPAESANLSECHLPIIQLAKELSVDGARVAKVMYGARGWMAHHNADIWKRATPVAGDPVWAIFQVGGAWLCRHAYEHYAFTGDTKYLKDIWPMLKGASLYFLDSMVKEPSHGWLATAPATNFESYFRKPNGETAAVCMGPTADMQIVRALFRDCIQASKALNTDIEFRKVLEKALPQLAPMQISPRTGELQEWIEDWDHADSGNGQMLSLWGLVCDNQITPRGTPDLARAIRKSLDDRKPWNTWVGSWTGAFASSAFARLADGKMASMVLDKHLASSVNPNLTANFQGMAEWEIDGNMGQTFTISEMLMQSQTQEIDLLPALPVEWSSGFVRGLRARGGFEVDVSWKHHHLEQAVIRSILGGNCRVRYGSRVKSLQLRPNQKAVIRF